ncbi:MULTISPECIES: hypothetical protein [unclassified Janthinobacterium]|uniref:hypothetical protein n=1 Tax=unclassified Janthinobacterium TaxID=2610881 RepID=UPI0012F821E6|nr:MULTISPECIES: hypothetical protein [unclassified Janthinobacterium]MEC5164198.1 hypothetical protein [Janthinobacterium sp. CG_S6]
MPDYNIPVLDIKPGLFPQEVQEAINAAMSQGDLFSVNGIRAFGGQVLKAGVVTFQPNSKLILNDYEHPWVAIVMNQLQFVDTSKDATLKLTVDWQPKIYQPPPAPPTSAKGYKAGVTQDGPRGTDGSRGTDGQKGDDAPSAPKLYIVCGGVADKQSQPIPAALKLSVIANGYSGSNGANGGAGGAGGDGGDGGDGEMGGGLLDGCRHSASNGGGGGLGGQGGAGGRGGNAASGADVVLVGPQDAWVALSYAAFEINPGSVGQGGYAGASGPSGRGGARGAHPGSCGGGEQGQTPATPPTPHDQAPHGAEGRIGIITKVIDNNVARFF